MRFPKFVKLTMPTLLTIVTAMAILSTLIDAFPLAEASPLTDERGLGFIVDYCDDDWNIQPPQFFYGKCENSTGGRSYMNIDLALCYTVDDKGGLSVDNWRQGGMAAKCDDCARCGDLDKDICLQCRCHRADGGRAWTHVNLDDILFVQHADNRICCGEWWGGPACGSPGLPLKPSVPGLQSYNTVDP